MATRGSYVHNSMVEVSGDIPKMLVLYIAQNIDGFRENDSQGF